jgi:Tol biopolymer transport system component
MKSYHKISIITASATLAAILMLAPVPGLGQSEDEKAKARAAAKAKAIAQAIENNSRIMTVYNRQGKEVGVVGDRGLYNLPVWSPDRTRVAVVRPEPEKEVNDLWVVEVASGKYTRITTSPKARETVTTPVWSPDGREIAFVALRDGSFGIYKKAASGEGAEELVYRAPGILTLVDWTRDGRYLGYFTSDLSGSLVYALPVAGERKPIELDKSKFQLAGPRFSPDGKFYLYASNETGRQELFMRTFDPAGGTGGGKWQISDQGGGVMFWRNDSKELYYIAPDRGFMAVEINTVKGVEAGKPKLLFNLGESIPINPATVAISRDGERFLVTLPPKRVLPQMTVFDRQGKVLSKVGEPGGFVQPQLSPDGTRVVVMRTDPKTAQNDIWTYEVATGKGYAITNDVEGQNAPIWSADGKQVAYVSTTQQGMPSIYRKAWDGTGEAEKVFTYTPGAGMVLTDWSSDGKFMTFWTQILVVVPLQGNVESRKGIEWLREEYNVLHGRFSPDMRQMAYITDQDENGKLQLYVRPFDAAKPEAPPPGAAVKVSGDVNGMLGWRADGKEMYFLQPDPQNTDGHVMAVEVTTAPEFKAGTPKELFKVPGPLRGNPLQWKAASADGQRFVFTIDAPAQ